MSFADCPRCGRRGYHRTRRGWWFESAFCQHTDHSGACGVAHGDVCCCGLDDIYPRSALDAIHDEDGVPRGR